MYCSAACQTALWAEHQRRCFITPETVLGAGFPFCTEELKALTSTVIASHTALWTALARTRSQSYIIEVCRFLVLKTDAGDKDVFVPLAFGGVDQNTELQRDLIVKYIMVFRAVPGPLWGMGPMGPTGLIGPTERVKLRLVAPPGMLHTDVQLEIRSRTTWAEVLMVIAQNLHVTPGKGTLRLNGRRVDDLHKTIAEDNARSGDTLQFSI